MWWMLPLLGAGIGAATSRKPLQGALLGAAAGSAPGLLGMGGAASAATNPALIESAVGSAGYGASSATPGLLGTFNSYAQPLSSALTIANQSQGLFGQRQMPQPAQLGATGDPIGQMMNSQQQQEMMRKQIMEKLQRRMYGGTL